MAAVQHQSFFSSCHFRLSTGVSVLVDLAFSDFVDPFLALLQQWDRPWVAWCVDCEWVAPHWWFARVPFVILLKKAAAFLPLWTLWVGIRLVNMFRLCKHE